MYRHDQRSQWLAMGLSALAGMIDAVGFLGSGGFFVSFMSGNTTRLGAGVGQANWTDGALFAFTVILAFVSGVVLGTLAKRRVPIFAKPPAILMAVAALITLCVLLASRIGPALPVFGLLAFAMGAINLVFESGGDVRIGVTYMTGALVKLGSHIADALLGARERRWLPFLLLWLALAVGAAAGTVLYVQFSLGALWVVAGLAWIASFIALRWHDGLG